jgi:hypothetical protein
MVEPSRIKQPSKQPRRRANFAVPKNREIGESMDRSLKEQMEERLRAMKERHERAKQEQAQQSTPVNSPKSHRDNSYRPNKNIETTADSDRIWTEDNLPEWLTPVVQNKFWAKRFAGLLNEGHAGPLEEFVKYAQAHAKNIFSYVNKCCSRANWPETLKRFSKAVEVARNVAEVARRIKVPKNAVKAVYKACWRLGTSVIRHAVTAQETGKADTFKYFCWLTSPRREKAKTCPQTV